MATFTMENFTVDFNWTFNGTTEEPLPTRTPLQETLHTVYTFLVTFLLVFIMFAMGCGLTIETIKDELKKPISPILGAISQFLLMPLMSFGIAHALQVDRYIGIGMITVASCPGGVVSNIFTLWSGGNLTLSVCMTSISTILALGFMPLNLYIYTRSWTDKAAVIPYPTLIGGIMATWVPVGIGMLLRRFLPRVARFVKIGGSVAGFVLIIVAGLIQRQIYPQVYEQPWYVWAAAVILPLGGWFVGYILAAIACRDWRTRTTIAYETGLQNGGLAMTLISLSYEAIESTKLLTFPLLYTAFQMVVAFVLMVIHRWYFRIKACRKTRKLKMTVFDDYDVTANGGHEKSVPSPENNQAFENDCDKPPLDNDSSKIVKTRLHNVTESIPYLNGDIIATKL